MTRICLSILAFIITFTCYAQAPVVQWQKSLAGRAYEIGRVAEKTADGGYIVTGTSSSNDGDVTGNHGVQDCWVVKLNDTGGIQWQRSFGGSGSDNALNIHQTTDGGYIMAGFTSSNDGDVTLNRGAADYWIVKMNDTGGIQWQKTYGGSQPDYAYSIRETSGGGYIISGSTYSSDGQVTVQHGNYDAWIVKIDDTGAIQWQRSIGGTGEDDAISIKETVGGGYIFSGQTESNNGDVTGNHGLFDYWIVKLNDTGGIVWQKTLGGSGYDNQGWTVFQTADGGYITSGFSRSNDGDVTVNHGLRDYWVVKISGTGELEWQKSYGGSGEDWGRGMTPAIGGGYILSGNSSSTDGDVTGNHGDSDYWILKINDTGGIVWQQSYGGTGADNAFGIQQLTDGGYIVAGHSNSNNGDVSGNHGSYDFWIVKLTCNVSAGTISGDTSLCTGHTATLLDTASGIVWGVTNGHATVSGGIVMGVSPGVDTITVTKTIACGTVITTFPISIVNCPMGVEQDRAGEGIHILPNPTTGEVFVAGITLAKISVHNYMGQLLLENNTTNRVNLSGYPAGMYLITVYNLNGEMVRQEKVVKLP